MGGYNRSMISTFLMAATLGITPEVELRQVFKNMGALRNAMIQVAHTSRESKSGTFLYERASSLMYASPNRFRLELNGYWGDTKLFICDGKTLHIDPSDDMQPIVLRPAPADLLASSGELTPKAFGGAMTWELLRGERGYDEVLDPNGEITKQGSTIAFKTKSNGRAWMTVENGWPSSIEFDNKAQLQAAYRFNPFWNSPVDDPMTREDIRIHPSARFPKAAFSTAVPKGRLVDDQRKPK